MDAASAAEIAALARILDELDYYELLEVPRDASSSAIRAAYHQASRRFHPDANRHLDPPVRRAVERIARRVSEAYSVLRDPRRRRIYDGKLAEAGRALRLPLVEAEAEAENQARLERGGRTPNGRRYFALAEAALGRGDWAAAERNLRTALAFEPDNALFREKLAALRHRSA